MIVKWMSCKKFTIKVCYGLDSTIIDTAPIAKKFIGQPVGNLVEWMQSFGGFKYEHLK